MNGTSFTTRDMELRDISNAMKLSSAEGWNQTEKDWKLLIQNPENVCLLVDDCSKIIGTTTAMNYSNQVAWIGMVLVDKVYRRQGVSKMLLTETFKRIEACPSIKLDATLDGQQVYKKFGFKEEYTVDRMATPSFHNHLIGEDGNLVVPIQAEHIHDIIAFDETVFGTKRGGLVEALVTQYPYYAWHVRDNNRVSGFVLGRDGFKFHQIGPLSARNLTDAKILISKTLQQLKHQAIVVDVPSDKVDWINWLASIGFSKQRTFVRMYKNQNTFPGVPQKQFLICGPEFG